VRKARSAQPKALADSRSDRFNGDGKIHLLALLRENPTGKEHAVPSDVRGGLN